MSETHPVGGQTCHDHRVRMSATMASRSKPRLCSGELLIIGKFSLISCNQGCHRVDLATSQALLGDDRTYLRVRAFHGSASDVRAAFLLLIAKHFGVTAGAARSVAAEADGEPSGPGGSAVRWARFCVRGCQQYFSERAQAHSLSFGKGSAGNGLRQDLVLDLTIP